MRHIITGKLLVALFAVLLFSLFSPTVSDAAPQNPRACLEDINKAVEAGDTQAFQELVNLDGILADAYATFLREARKPENSPKIPPMLAIILAQASSGENGKAIQTLLIGEIKAFILNGIASGSFAGKKLDPAQKQGVLAPLFAQASTGKKEIRNIGDSYPDGDGWLATFVVHDSGNGNDYDVIGRFIKDDGGVRLASIKNMEQLFQRIQRESEAAQEN